MNKIEIRRIRTLTVLFLLVSFTGNGRSPFRTPDPLLPKLEVTWARGGKTFSIADSHIEEYPYFKLFDRDFLEAHAIPEGKILIRNSPDQQVEGALLVGLIEQLLEEIKQKKQSFTHFTVMQNKDFNKKKRVGLLILKYNNYPFVVKLFIETPESFVHPFEKGFEPIFFFFLGGGTSRHLNGFTRIKNLHIVRDQIQKNKRWSSYVDFPRKWFWMPKTDNWIEITGYNLGTSPQQHIKIPGTYCVISDEIQTERHFSIYNRSDRRVALDLCNDLEQLIDPHINNFIIEKETHKLVVIDTEHFPTVVGFTETRKFNSYTHWYTTLMRKCLGDIYGRTKQTRRQAQFNKQSSLFLT